MWMPVNSFDVVKNPILDLAPQPSPHPRYFGSLPVGLVTFNQLT